MVVGFVLVTAAPSREDAVYRKLLEIKEIMEMHPLFGEFDLIARVEAPDLDAMQDVVVNKVRLVPGVMQAKALTNTRFG